MTEAEAEKVEAVDPNESPFSVPPIAGIPYGRGSEEDLAIRAIIADAEREQREASQD